MPSTNQTAAEAKAERVAKMGEDLGELYDALWQQVAWLHRKWGDYVALFGTKPSRVELLNQAAPAFFRNVQDAMWEDVLLHIARLTDSPQSVGKPNLSFRRLPATVAHAATRAKVEVALEKALVDSDFSPRPSPCPRPRR
jgi:AbiU2